MANCVLAHPDFVLPDPTFAAVGFSGGNWLDDLPLNNLLRPELAYIARSSDCNPESTRMWIDLGAVRPVLGVFIPKFNGSRDARYRIRAYPAQGDEHTGEVGRFRLGRSTAGSGILADTGWKDFYPATYPIESLYWGHASLWDGKMSAEDAAVFPMPIVAVFGSVPVIAQYWLIEFDDPNNAAGYVELPRVFIAGGWQPLINMSWGASLAVEDPSIEQRSMGGALTYAQRPKRRVQRFSLGFIKLNDAMIWVNDMQERLGTQGQLFFVQDPENLEHMHRRSFLSHMRVLSPLQYAAYGNNIAPFELEEIVA